MNVLIPGVHVHGTRVLIHVVCFVLGPHAFNMQNVLYLVHGTRALCIVA